MNLSMVDDKEVKHLLKAIKKANRKRRDGEPLVDFVLIGKAPERAPYRVQIISGTVPVSFKYTPRTPLR